MGFRKRSFRILFLLILPFFYWGVSVGCSGGGGGSLNLDPSPFSQNLGNPGGLHNNNSPSDGTDDGSRPSGQVTEIVQGKPMKAFIEGHVLLRDSPHDKSCEQDFGATPQVTVFRKGIQDADFSAYPAPNNNSVAVNDCGHFNHIFSYGQDKNGVCNVAYKYKAVITDKQGNTVEVESDPIECPITGQNNPLILILQPGYSGVLSEPIMDGAVKSLESK